MSWLSSEEQEVYYKLAFGGPRRTDIRNQHDWIDLKSAIRGDRIRVLSATDPPETLSGTASHDAVLLRSLMAARKSRRDLWRKLTFKEISSLLALTFEPTSLQPPRNLWASVGGLNAIEFVIVAYNIEGLKQHAYLITRDRSGVSLMPIAPLDESYQEFAKVALGYWGLTQNQHPASIILALSHWAKLGTHYEYSVFYSGVAEAAIALHTISQIASSMSLNSCLSSCVQPDIVGRWLGINPTEVGHIGTIGLGGGDVANAQERTLN